MFKMRLSYILTAALLLNTSCIFKSKSKSDFNAETDDTETELSKNVIETGSKFENYVNSSLKVLRRENTTKTPAGKDFLDKNGLIEGAFETFGKELPGTGYGIPGVLEVSRLVAIENWFLSLFDAKKSEILFVPWDKSKYRETEIGFFISLKNKNPMLLSKGIANRAIFPVVRQNGTLVGIDKWGHFFGIGYAYFSHLELRNSKEKRDNMTRWLEGDLKMTEAEKAICAKIGSEIDSTWYFGTYGTYGSGLYSVADGHANEGGFHFFNDLYKDPSHYEFKLSSLDLKSFNEQYTPSINNSSVKISQ